MTVRLIKLSPILKQYIFNWSWLIMVFVLHITRLQSQKRVHMRCLHLPRRHAITSSTFFRTIVHASQMATNSGECVYIAYNYRANCMWIIEGLIGTNPYGDWTQIRREIERKSYGAYAASMQRLSGDNTIYFDKKSTENRTFAARSSRELR